MRCCIEYLKKRYSAISARSYKYSEPVASEQNMDSASSKKAESVASSVDPLLLMPGHKLSKMIKAGTVSIERLCSRRGKLNLQ